MRAGERPGWHRVFLPVALLYHEGKRERSRDAAQIQRPALVKRRLSAFSIMIFGFLLNFKLPSIKMDLISNIELFLVIPEISAY